MFIFCFVFWESNFGVAFAIEKWFVNNNTSKIDINNKKHNKGKKKISKKKIEIKDLKRTVDLILKEVAVILFAFVFIL